MNAQGTRRLLTFRLRFGGTDPAQAVQALRVASMAARAAAEARPELVAAVSFGMTELAAAQLVPLENRSAS
jgi:hypothetical protein